MSQNNKHWSRYIIVLLLYVCYNKLKTAVKYLKGEFYEKMFKTIDNGFEFCVVA